MNKVQERQITENHVDLNEEQQILNDAENIIKKCNNNTSCKVKKTCLFVLLPLFIVLILVLFFSTIFAILNINKSTIINGVYVYGIDVSNLTIDDATKKVSDILNSQLSKEIKLNHNEYSLSISPEQFGASFDIESAINSAYNLGRDSNIFKNNYSIICALSTNINIGPSILYDTDLLNSIIEEINTNIPDAVIQPDYYIDGTSLVISNGQDGVVVNNNSLLNSLLFELGNNKENSIVIDIPVTNQTKNSIDIESIYNTIKKDAVDAYFTTDPYVLYPSSTGVDFDISMEEAKNIIATEQEEYTIPLKILYPNVTTNQIGTEAFPDKLSSFSTSYTSSNYSRSTNIELATSKINGTVLMPGETFSYNQTVGQRTKAAGFKEAPAYVGGKTVLEYGGGICQVSSTLYNAVLYANLEITERYNHGYKPSYVKPGFDATVSWGGPDFKFTNNRTYPIKIVCYTSGKHVYFDIYGLKTDNDYTVVLDAQFLSTVYAQTVYQNDSSLASDQTKVIESGSNGCKTATYKTLYDLNGNYVSSECISRDTYNAHNKIIAVGN